MLAALRPRYWIPAIDRWSLAAPVLLVLVVTALAMLPAPPVAAVRKTPVAPPPRALAPSVIESPRPGTVFISGAIGDLAGTAEPGGLVRLYHDTQVLGQTVATAEGRFLFHLANFPQGPHTLRVETIAGPRSVWSGEVTFTVQKPAKATSPKKNAPKKKPVR